MAFYPILKAPYCKGRVTLHNYPPNNWENFDKKTRYIFATFLQDDQWNNVFIGELKYGESRSFQLEDFDFTLNDDTFILLSLSVSFLKKTSKKLPKLLEKTTSNPAWRATLSLISKFTETSYQGEINPFPEKASLLTFNLFGQFGDNVENYILLLNVEKNPVHRPSKIEIYALKSKKILKTQFVESNKINIVSLDGFDNSDLLGVVCRDMAFIPLYFSTEGQGRFLSLEHTHPPSKFVVHGDRFGVQRHLKNLWFSQLNLK
jgi:hypothetical protein